MAQPRPRAHLVAGGFPPGAAAGHDHDYARLRLLQLFAGAGVQASVSNDFVDVERWLPLSRLLVTYTAGPYLDDGQSDFVDAWLRRGGRWLALHGTSGGRAARLEGTRQRAMVRMKHHEVLGGFFINHPPVRRFGVDLTGEEHPVTRGLPQSFEVIDEPYMVEVVQPEQSRLLLTSRLGPDASPPGFGFIYEKDTALLADGQTRPIAYSKPAGRGEVVYTTLGHCHSPETNSQPFVDPSVDPEGRTPPTLRVTWEAPAYELLLRNGVHWGVEQREWAEGA